MTTTFCRSVDEIVERENLVDGEVILDVIATEDKLARTIQERTDLRPTSPDLKPISKTFAGRKTDICEPISMHTHKRHIKTVLVFARSKRLLPYLGRLPFGLPSSLLDSHAFLTPSVSRIDFCPYQSWQSPLSHAQASVRRTVIACRCLSYHN